MRNLLRDTFIVWFLTFLSGFVIGISKGLGMVSPTKEMIAAGDMLTYSQERFKVSEVYRAMIATIDIRGQRR